jgi:hypothetical protein
VPVEFWNSLWSFLTFLVIAATVVPAVLQMRHLSSNNQIQTLLALEHDFNEPDLQTAFHFVQNELAARLEDPAYREALARLGFVDPRAHPEMKVCNWFEQMGTFVNAGMVEERAFFDLFGRLVDHYWVLLAPAIAIMRRQRGPRQYQNFEAMTSRYRRWAKQHPAGIYPRDVPRLKLEDAWKSVDEKPSATSAKATPLAQGAPVTEPR